MRLTTTPDQPRDKPRAIDEKAALAQAIESYRIPPHVQKRLIVLRTVS